MSEIKRYEPAMRNLGKGPQVGMRETSDGSYVEWERINSLELRIAELEGRTVTDEMVSHIAGVFSMTTGIPGRDCLKIVRRSVEGFAALQKGK